MDVKKQVNHTHMYICDFADFLKIFFLRMKNRSESFEQYANSRMIGMSSKISDTQASLRFWFSFTYLWDETNYN